VVLSATANFPANVALKAKPDASIPATRSIDTGDLIDGDANYRLGHNVLTDRRVSAADRGGPRYLAQHDIFRCHAAARGIATLTLATGLCSSIFWPVSEFALHHVDWRVLCQIYAALTLLFCMPVHLWLARRYGQLRAGEGDSEIPAAPAHISSGAERTGFNIQTMIASCGALITVGFGIAVIDIFQQLGTARTEAVFAGSLIGIAFVVSRGLATLWADRITPVRLAKLVYLLLPLCFVPLLVCAAMNIALPGWLAAIVALSFGLPAGLVGILRSTFSALSVWLRRLWRDSRTSGTHDRTCQRRFTGGHCVADGVFCFRRIGRADTGGGAGVHRYTANWPAD